MNIYIYILKSLHNWGNTFIYSGMHLITYSSSYHSFGIKCLKLCFRRKSQEQNFFFTFYSEIEHFWVLNILQFDTSGVHVIGWNVCQQPSILNVSSFFKLSGHLKKRKKERTKKKVRKEKKKRKRRAEKERKKRRKDLRWAFAFPSHLSVPVISFSTHLCNNPCNISRRSFHSFLGQSESLKLHIVRCLW